MVLLVDPREDELLYSILARTFESLGNVSATRFKRFVFGSNSLSTTTIFPSHLERLVTTTRAWGNLTVDTLIERHTLFPAFAAFWTTEQQEAMRRYMRGDISSASPTPPAGQGHFNVYLKEVLYCCPECIVEDRQCYGEAHFRRSHQLQDVWWCVRHNVPLRKTAVRFDNHSSTRRTYITLESALNEGTNPTPVAEASGTLQSVLLILAEYSIWLLDYKKPIPSRQWLARRVKTLLHARGYVTNRGVLRTQALFDALEKRLTSGLLKMLGCSINRTKGWNWVTLITKERMNVLHPTQYLLLMVFLSVHPRVFFSNESTITEVSHPYGIGPWPCLNPAADHFDQNVVTRLPIETRGGWGYIFSCDLCGYQYYVRRGGSLSTAQVRVAGPVWEAELRRLAAEPSMTLEAASRRLRLSRESLRRFCIKLNIGRWETPRGGREGSNTRELVKQRRNSERDARINIGRNSIAVLRAKNPSWSRSQIDRDLGEEYSWLMRNDRIWMEENLPKARKQRGVDLRGTRRGRLELDAVLAQEAREISKQLRSQVQPIIRVTSFAIISRLSIRIYSDMKSRFPLTASTIMEEVERVEEYNERKMRQVAEIFIEQGVKPKPWRLLRIFALSKRNASLVALAERIAWEAVAPVLPSGHV